MNQTTQTTEKDKRKERKAAYLQITRECNNKCVFCSNPQFERKPTLDELKNKILEFKRRDITEILLTGGEPTTSEYLFQVIDFCNQNNIKPRMITNGVNLSDKEFTKKLLEHGIDSINLSLHIHDPVIGDQLSQKQGHHKKSLIGLKNAIETGINVNLNSTINSKNCKHLPRFIRFVTINFPEITHFVFNNLDPGMADGNIQSKAGENSWIVARFVDFELELARTVRLLKKSNKTFRIERVPLCYMVGFEEFSTETRKIVKNEKYICSFLEQNGKDETRTITPDQLRTKIKVCKSCKLDPICAGVQQEYIDIHGDKEMYAVFEDPKKIIEKIK